MGSLVRAIPRLAASRHRTALAALLFVACAPEPALRHGTVPMPLESVEPTSSSPPAPVASLLGTRACLGTLVTRRLVLTAAHCVVEGARHSHVRVGQGLHRSPVAISGCRVHPLAYGAPTACEVTPPGRLDTAHDLALLDLLDDVPPQLARPLPVLLRRPPRFLGARLLVVSAHATEFQSDGPWRVSWHRAESLRDGKLRTRSLAGHPFLGTRPGDSGGPALLERAGTLIVVGALSGGHTAWSPDSRYATTFEPENATWLRARLGPDAVSR